MLSLAVVYIAKVRILEQITTESMILTNRVCCCLYSKGKNFRANHNNMLAAFSKINAVVYIAKVRILEQITTANNGISVFMGCCLYSKGKNFRANHNTRSEATPGPLAVVYIAKVRILEQITTKKRPQKLHDTLLFI